MWPLALYTVARIINAIMIAMASGAAITPPPGGLEVTGYFVADEAPAPPGYLTTVTNWDGQWYWQIATDGYPDEVPRDASGDVIQNVFAFFPLFPMIARALMAISGLGFPVVATLLSFTFGAISTLLLYKLVLRRSDVLGARIAVVCLSAFTCAPVFLMAYTDALALALVLSVLWCVIREKYVWAAGVLLPLAFTRNVVAAFALFFVCPGLHPLASVPRGWCRVDAAGAPRWLGGGARRSRGQRSWPCARARSARTSSASRRG